MKKRILVKADPQVGYTPVLEGICSTVSSINGGIYIWNPLQKSTYDTFYESRPDFLICMDRSVDKALANVTKEYPDTKTITIGPDVPDYFTPTLTCYPNASGEHLYDLQPAASLIDYFSGKEKQKYKSDISTISANETPVLAGLSDFALKSFSYTRKMKYPNYIGKILPEEIANIFASCIVYLDTDGNNDLLLSAMANRCACVSAAGTIFDKDYMPMVANMKELVDCIKALVLKSSFRKEHIEKCYEFVMAQHTYFHRVSDIFSLLGEEDLSKDCLSKMEGYL